MSFHLISPAFAAANTWSGSCVGGSAAGGWGGSSVGGVDASDVATIQGIECLIQNLISPLPGIIALCSVGLMIYAGFRIITAGSDAKALQSAWSTFTWAAIGLILIAVVWVVLVLIENFTGVQVTKFGL